MSRIELLITYCDDGRDEEAALGLARRLFARLDTAIDTLTLVPVPEEDFAVHLNGRLIHSQRQVGRPPLAADVLAALGADVEPASTAPADRP